MCTSNTNANFKRTGSAGAPNLEGTYITHHEQHKHSSTKQFA